MTRRPPARPVFAIRLQPLPGVADPIKALRAALKVLKRAYKLRCLDVRQLGGSR